MNCCCNEQYGDPALAPEQASSASAEPGDRKAARGEESAQWSISIFNSFSDAEQISYRCLVLSRTARCLERAVQISHHQTTWRATLPRSLPRLRRGQL